MFGKLEEAENEIRDLVMEIDAENALKIESSVQSLEDVLEVAEIAICQWHGDMEIERANQRFLSNLLLQKDASKEQIKQKIRETIFAEDLIRLKEEYARCFNEIGRDTWVSEFRQRLNGKTKWFRFGLIVKRSDNEELFTFVCWDISKDKELCHRLSHSEKTLKEQNEKLSKIVFDLAATNGGRTEVANVTSENLSASNVYSWNYQVSKGLFEIEICSLMMVNDKIHPEDLDKIKLICSQLATQKEQPFFSEEIRLDYDGLGYKWFEFRGSITERNEEGAPIEIGGICFDIQPRKNKEAAMQQEIDRLREQERRRTLYFTNLTQEMRTPLHAIVGFADLLTAASDDIERTKYLDVIKNNNESLLNLIEGAIEFTDIEQPEEELRKDTVCLWEYLVELHQIHSMKIASGVKLMFTNSYDSRRIIIDKEKFADAVGILLNNAIQYTHKGYISYGYEFKGDKLIFSLSDTGEVVEARNLNDLYALKDLKENSATPREFNLSVCKSLINRMGGSILVDVTPDSDTVFTIEMPLVWDTTSQPAIEEVEEKSEPEELQIVKNDKQLPIVLVAEDTLYSFLMLKTLLEDRYEVVHAENGLHAVELFSQMNPVFVFMDIKMPIMDGIEATRRIRQISKDVPIVVLTAYAVRSLRKDAAEAGCTDMLTKPTSTKQINATIRKYLKKDN